VRTNASTQSFDFPDQLVTGHAVQIVVHAPAPKGR
jgi:hypothetical protein